MKCPTCDGTGEVERCEAICVRDGVEIRCIDRKGHIMPTSHVGQITMGTGESGVTYWTDEKPPLAPFWLDPDELDEIQFQANLPSDDPRKRD